MRAITKIGNPGVKHDNCFDQKCCEFLTSLCGWQHWRCGGWIYAMAFILAVPRRWFFTLQHFRRVAVCWKNTYVWFSEVLQILTTGPVGTATNERSFSALRYLKTYLPFTTKEDRLNGLALLYVPALIINFEHVIDEFSRKNYRLHFNWVQFWHTASVNFFAWPIIITSQFVSVNALKAIV